MISKKAFKLYALRVQMMPLGGASFYTWDKFTSKIVRANNYLIIGSWGGIFAGLVFVAILGLQLYMKLTFVNDEEEAPEMSLREFGSQMVLVGEMLLITCIMFLNLRCGMRMDDFIYLMNQMFDYNNFILEMLKSKNIQLDASHRRNMLLMDMLMTFIFVISLSLPFGIAAALFHPMEPTHRIFEEWLEIEVGFYGFFIPFYFAAAMCFYAAGNFVVILCWNIACYYVIATTCLQDLKPEQLEQQIGVGTRFQVGTTFNGVMRDNEVVNVYRVQKLFNVLMNEFYANILVSFHHVALMGAVSIMMYFAIKFQELVWEGGLLAAGVTLLTILIPLMIIRIQCLMCGQLVDMSRVQGLCGESREEKIFT